MFSAFLCWKRRFEEVAIISPKRFCGSGERIVFGSDADALPLLGGACVIDVGKIRAIVKRHFCDLGGDETDSNACPGTHGRIEQKLAPVGCVKDAVDVAIFLVLVTDRDIHKVRAIGKRKCANVLNGSGNLNSVDLFLPVADKMRKDEKFDSGDVKFEILIEDLFM